MFSLILPTYNEAENLPELLPQIEHVLQGIEYEIIIVDDDSPDGTWQVALQLSEKDDRVHVIRRVGRRGLSSAAVEGFLSAKGEILAVMDADGQHDLSKLPMLYDTVQSGVNIAVGSRYVEGGSVGNWDERRYLLSRIATALAVRLCTVHVRDPMSGFFAVDRRTFESTLPRLNPKGFKILLDFLVHVPKGTTAKEIPIVFSARMHGESKMSRRVQIEFLEYLYDVTVGHFIPLTFVKFCIVGFLGVFVQLGVYYLFSRVIIPENISAFANFSFAEIIAIETAIIFNFILDNLWTFAAQRLRGARFFTGLVTFNAACAVGALANYATGAFLIMHHNSELLSLLAGIAVATFWNYAINRMMTWRG